MAKPMITEITIYQLKDKTYCTECKPKGSKRGMLVLSLPDRVFCSGCGRDLYDIAAINQALAQPDLGPFTVAELEQMVKQVGSIMKRNVQCVQCGDWLEEWEIHPESDIWMFCIPCGEKFLHGNDFLAI